MRTTERCVRAGSWGSAALLLALLSPVMRAQYPGGDWVVSTPQAEGMDPARFASAMASMLATAIVIRHGKIIGTKGDITRAGYLYSGSKALLATLAAVMMQRGAITFDTLVPGSDRPAPPQANIRHFLTMTSDYNLSPHSPGGHYAYSNSGAIHYGEFLIFTFFPNSTAVQVMRDTFLDKIGIQDGLSLIGDISGWGGGGFKMSTRDYARLGLLYLRNGNWNGEQLLAPEFMAGLYVNQVPPAATAQGTTVTTTAEMQPLAPGLFLCDPENRRCAAAQHAAGFGVVGKPGLYPGSTPARPGKIVILYGTGFGPTNPRLPAGRVITQAARLANPSRVTIGGLEAQVLWDGLSGAGLYQLNVLVPEGLPDGDAAVIADSPDARLRGVRLLP